MKIQFQTVDVFTREQFGGNPLAVVPDARGLSSGQMQQIAAEFNLSETTFVLPATSSGNTAEVRIFTPKAEMPFAGHPNVGTAFVLARRGTVFGRKVNLSVSHGHYTSQIAGGTFRHSSRRESSGRFESADQADALARPASGSRL